MAKSARADTHTQHRHTHAEFCLLSGRTGRRHNLNPYYITNLRWIQISLNTLMVYTQGQNNFPQEGFSGDNLSNAVWVRVMAAFHREKTRMLQPDELRKS